MRSMLALSVLAIAALSKAQYTIDPESVTQANRGNFLDAWCLNQKSQCPLICLQQPGVTTQNTEENECDPDTLDYSCICDNGISPNLTMYSQTIPYYICTEWGTQCVNNCNGVQSCQADCLQKHPCGAQSPNKGNASLSTSAVATSVLASATSSFAVVGFGPAATGTSNGDKGGAASAMLDLGSSYSLAVVFASVFLGFAVLL
ncbi:hypothetical protein K505DRAFT_235064 [Melanomma pulvis-pyrius CBS 109.77]|uniref:DUF7707 domain-containing protein n=1 Tax=Melanomma pulvis-pyrius CBS 109.77 TaxID=1314802 RepID=A0A6A6XM91_9PLEO|nr:hypothetical protein K505DRAFT_235064 [Melanomma pulvis-pyrius CBS 109.77]